MLKRIFLFILLISLLTGAAHAQNAGTLNNGGFVLSAETLLYIARPDGLYLLEEGKTPKKLTSAFVTALQAHGERLYFLENTPIEGENAFEKDYLQTPVSCLLDGSDRLVLGEGLRTGALYDFGDTETSPVTINCYIGYGSFTVRGDFLYYLKNTGESGEYACSAHWENYEGETETVTRTGLYPSGIALFRCGLNGENEERLTPVLGNALSLMAVENDKIYLCESYADTVYAYNHVNYEILTTDGESYSVFANRYPEELNNVYTCEKAEFYHLPIAILPFGDSMLVSLSDSEGDFVASRLVKLGDDGKTELIALEQGFVPSILDGTTVYYAGCDSRFSYYDDDADYQNSIGIYRKDVYEDGMGVKLCPLPCDGIYGLQLAVQNQYVYFTLYDELLLRAHAESGAMEVFSPEEGFIPYALTAY